MFCRPAEDAQIDRPLNGSGRTSQAARIALFRTWNLTHRASKIDRFQWAQHRVGDRLRDAPAGTKACDQCNQARAYVIALRRPSSVKPRPSGPAHGLSSDSTAESV